MNETHIDLFSGLGCWAIAARANGLRTIAFCEREEWLASGLERIWKVPCHRAIETFPASDYAGRVWLLTGSPPCQPASLAGKRRGTADDRWLWDETVDVCKVVQPAWFVFENPPGIDGVGLDGIISDMERLGYEVATLRIPACAVDSAQDRDRFWIVGHAEKHNWRLPTRPKSGKANPESARPTQSSPLADSRNSGLQECPSQPGAAQRSVEGGTVADGDNEQARRSEPSRQENRAWPGVGGLAMRSLREECEWITFNERLYRVPTSLHELAIQFAAGIPKKFRGRLISALGNAIHWKVASQIIAAIKQADV